MTSFALLEEDPRYMVDSDGFVYGPKAGELKKFAACKGKYHQVGIGGVRRYVHRVVAETFIPNPEGKPDVAHGDNDGLNNAAWNLRWATESENMADKRVHGTHIQGENHGKARLTDEDVLRIRELKQDEYWHVDDIAAAYGVSRWTIYDACNTKRRKLAADY